MTNLQLINEEISTINNLTSQTEEDIKKVHYDIYKEEKELSSLKRDYEKFKMGNRYNFGDNVTASDIENWIKCIEKEIKTIKEKKELFIKYLEKLEINKEKLIRDYVNLSNNQDNQDNQDLIYFLNKQEETDVNNNKFKKQGSSDEILKKVFGDKIL